MLVGGLCWGLLHFVGCGREAIDVALHVGFLALPLFDVLLHVGKLGSHEIDDGDRDGLVSVVAPEHCGFDVNPVDACMVEHVEAVIRAGETHVRDLRVGDLSQHIVALGEDEPTFTHVDLADRVEQPQE